MKQLLQLEYACKYVVAEIDAFWSFANTPSSKVEQPIKHIGMTIMEPYSEWEAENYGFRPSDSNINQPKGMSNGKMWLKNM